MKTTKGQQIIQNFFEKGVKEEKYLSFKKDKFFLIMQTMQFKGLVQQNYTVRNHDHELFFYVVPRRFQNAKKKL